VQVALNLGMNTPYVIHTPLMWIDKARIWTLAQSLGGDALIELIREETHTCYTGDREHRWDWGYGCGSCPACRLRSRGWQAYSELGEVT
jgi:7-cyano-7-deazaguanine synthase